MGLSRLRLCLFFAAAPALPAVGPAWGDSVPTGLPGASAYLTVPPQFDPRAANDADLDRYGFPPRPDAAKAPLAYESWRQGVAGMQRILPVLQPMPIWHGPLRTQAAGLGNVTATSSNWSGYVTASPAFSYGSQSITAVFGDWMIPVAQPAFNACHPHGDSNAQVYSSTWVGIDGSGSGDVLQAGTESDAVCSSGVVGPFHSAWYEWYPYNEVRVTNLPIAPGEALYVHVWAKHDQRGHAYLANKSTRQSVAIEFYAPANVKLIGNSAEWIIERPSVDGQTATLTNYVQEFLANAYALDAQGNTYTPGATEPLGEPPALQIQMTDDTNTVISSPTLLGQNSIWFSDSGSAKHIPKS